MEYLLRLTSLKGLGEILGKGGCNVDAKMQTLINLGTVFPSGTNDKAGSGVYVMKWVSMQSIKESTVPVTSWKYPHQS